MKKIWMLIFLFFISLSFVNAYTVQRSGNFKFGNGSSKATITYSNGSDSDASSYPIIYDIESMVFDTENNKIKIDGWARAAYENNWGKIYSLIGFCVSNDSSSCKNKDGSQGTFYEIDSSSYINRNFFGSHCNSSKSSCKNWINAAASTSDSVLRKYESGTVCINGGGNYGCLYRNIGFSTSISFASISNNVDISKEIYLYLGIVYNKQTYKISNSKIISDTGYGTSKGSYLISKANTSNLRLRYVRVGTTADSCKFSDGTACSGNNKSSSSYRVTVGKLDNSVKIAAASTALWQKYNSSTRKVEDSLGFYTCRGETKKYSSSVLMYRYHSKVFFKAYYFKSQDCGSAKNKNFYLYATWVIPNSQFSFNLNGISNYFDFYKYDENGNMLSKAKLQILDENKNIVDEWTSTNSAKRLALNDGIFYLHESSAPSGYVKTNDIKFEISGKKLTVISSDINNYSAISTNGLAMIDYPNNNGNTITIKKIGKFKNGDDDYEEEYLYNTVLKLYDGNNVICSNSGNYEMECPVSIGKSYVLKEDYGDVYYNNRIYENTNTEGFNISIDLSGNIVVDGNKSNYYSVDGNNFILYNYEKNDIDSDKIASSCEKLSEKVNSLVGETAISLYPQIENMANNVRVRVDIKQSGYINDFVFNGRYINAGMGLKLSFNYINYLNIKVTKVIAQGNDVDLTEENKNDVIKFIKNIYDNSDLISNNGISINGSINDDVLDFNITTNQSFSSESLNGIFESNDGVSLINSYSVSLGEAYSYPNIISSSGIEHSYGELSYDGEYNVFEGNIFYTTLDYEDKTYNLNIELSNMSALHSGSSTTFKEWRLDMIDNNSCHVNVGKGINYTDNNNFYVKFYDNDNPFPLVVPNTTNATKFDGIYGYNWYAMINNFKDVSDVSNRLSSNSSGNGSNGYVSSDSSIYDAVISVSDRSDFNSSIVNMDYVNLYDNDGNNLFFKNYNDKKISGVNIINNIDKSNNGYCSVDYDNTGIKSDTKCYCDIRNMKLNGKCLKNIIKAVEEDTDGGDGE